MEEIQTGAEKVSQEIDETEVLTDAQDTSNLDAEEKTGDQTDSPADWETKYKKLENDFNSVKGKTSSLEKRARELEQAAKLVEALNNAAINDPEFKKMANKKLVEQGLLPASYLDELEQSSPTRPERADAQQTPVQQAPVQADPALTWARQKQREELENEIKFFEDFESSKPDIAEGEANAIKARRGAISAAANVNLSKGMSKREAYELAYIQILHPEKLKEEGEVEGLVKARQAPVMTGGLGQAAKTQQTNQLTAEERRVAQAFGMSDEEYAAYKNQ